MVETSDEGTEKLYYDPLSVSRRTLQKNIFVEEHDKARLLSHLIKEHAYTNTIVIVKTKKSADSVKISLEAEGIKVLALHANKNKQERDEAVKSFNDNSCDVLITTDMMLQSYEFPSVKQMISYNLPLEVQHYYARLACMNEKGEGLALVSEEEEHIMEMLEWAMKIEIPQIEVDGFTPSDKPEVIQAKIKDRSKKPRHKKTKSSKSDKKA